ncbi:MAG: hypothetical protein U9R19_17200, partial [Bacteroidota bacterium]|nr:hypothetical protein [Bacteroidota bacterium]
MILDSTDFIGEYAIPNEAPFFQDSNSTFLDDKEKYYLKKLLGITAYNELRENLLTIKWLDIINGLEYQIRNRTYFITGVKTMLLNFVYYEMQLNLWNLSSSSGFVIPKMENSEPENKLSVQGRIYGAYNEALRIYNSLIMYFYEHNITETLIASSVIDNGDDTYTFTISDTS